jgi:hypothetical protein
MGSFNIFATAAAMMMIAVSAAAVMAEVAHGASGSVKAAVPAAEAVSAANSEKAELASGSMRATVRDAAPVQRGGYADEYPGHPVYPPPVPHPYPVYHGKGKAKKGYRAYNGRGSPVNAASVDVEASVHDAAPVQRGDYGYPVYPHYPPHPYPVYYGKGKGRKY